jgi:Concanavalin A-like lectin/glucanases superfamily
MEPKDVANKTIPLQQTVNQTVVPLEDIPSQHVKLSKGFLVLLVGLVLICLALGGTLLFVLSAKSKNQASSALLSVTPMLSATNAPVSPTAQNQAGSATGNEVSAITPSSSYEAAVLGDKPIVYWRLDEKSGDTAQDTSGNKNEGKYSGGITFGSAGAIGHDTNTAISSDGTGVITLPALQTVTNFTFEGWTYLTDPTWNSIGNYNNTIYGYGKAALGSNGKSASGLFVAIRPGVSNKSAYALGYFQVALNGKEYALQPKDAAADNVNQWVYWAVVRSGSTFTVYRNGVQVGQRTDLPATATADISGSALAYYHTYFLKGRVDEIAMYPSALSPNRIQAHYNSAK